MPPNASLVAFGRSGLGVGSVVERLALQRPLPVAVGRPSAAGALPRLASRQTASPRTPRRPAFASARPARADAGVTRRLTSGAKRLKRPADEACYAASPPRGLIRQWYSYYPYSAVGPTRSVGSLWSVRAGWGLHPTQQPSTQFTGGLRTPAGGSLSEGRQGRSQDSSPLYEPALRFQRPEHAGEIPIQTPQPCRSPAAASSPARAGNAR